MREKEEYRDSLAFITQRLGKKGFYTTREIATLDYGELVDKQMVYRALRATRKRYDITDGGLPAETLARKRAEM